MNPEKMWEATGLRFDETGNLVIDAIPGYGNRKRWDGEMEFHLTDGQKRDLLEKLQAQLAKDRMIEVATVEMQEYMESVKADYHKERQKLADGLSLPVEDIPQPVWWTIQEMDKPVTIHPTRSYF